MTKYGISESLVVLPLSQTNPVDVEKGKFKTTPGDKEIIVFNWNFYKIIIITTAHYAENI